MAKMPVSKDPNAKEKGMDKGGNGSQFFIIYKENHLMDGKFTIIGEVVDGAGEEAGSTLSKLEATIVDKKGRVKGEPVVIRDVTIHSNPFADNLVRSK